MKEKKIISLMKRKVKKKRCGKGALKREGLGVI